MFLESFDLPIQRFLSSFIARSDFFDHCVFALSIYDIFEGIVMVSLLWLVWFHHAPEESPEQQDERHVTLLIVFAGSIAAVLLARILQLGLHIHQRPIVLQISGLKFPAFLDPAKINAWNSFPSDHAMLFGALAFGLWQVNRLAGVFAFFWAIVMVDLPRVYLGLHYPSDAIAGTIFGIGFIMVIERLPLRGMAHRVIVWSKTHPAMFYCCAFLATDQVAHLFDDIIGIALHTLGYFSGH